MSGNGWLDEGVAKRTMWGHPNPVVAEEMLDPGDFPRFTPAAPSTSSTTGGAA